MLGQVYNLARSQLQYCRQEVDEVHSPSPFRHLNQGGIVPSTPVLGRQGRCRLCPPLLKVGKTGLNPEH
jgi:hypothetical protein